MTPEERSKARFRTAWAAFHAAGGVDHPEAGIQAILAALSQSAPTKSCPPHDWAEKPGPGDYAYCVKCGEVRGHD